MPEIKRDPKVALVSAIETLEQFARQEKSPDLSFSVQDGQLISSNASSFEKVFTILTSVLSKRAREQQQLRKKQVHNVVLKAIGTVKRNHLFIAKMQQGNVQEKQLAATALSAIKNYNAALDQKKAKGFAERFINFCCSLIGLNREEDFLVRQIDLPPSSGLSQENLHQDILESVKSAPLLTQEADSIRMKTSMLLKQHGIEFKSISDALHSVKTSPIHASVDSGTGTSTISLTLDVLPGTTIKVSGSFKRDKGCVPIADSFHLAVTSAHTGYPHPSQVEGWGFCDELLPNYPHHLEKLSHFAIFYAKKKEFSKALLPNGDFIEKAKEIHLRKKHVFQQNKTRFLEFHREICIVLLNCANNREETNIISRYFQALQKSENVLEDLSKTWRHINNYFIVRPITQLQKDWTDQKTLLFALDPLGTYKVACSILEEERQRSETTLNKICANSADKDEIDKCRFIILMGNKIAKGCYPIALQHWSETFESTPVSLDDFSKKIQLCAYTHLQTFFEDLEVPVKEEDIMSTFETRMKRDIALFSNGFSVHLHPFFSIVDELEKYYDFSS